MPNLPDIANILEWKDMKQLNYPNDTQEQCSNLLRAWVEKEGMTTAAKTLIQTLHRMNKKAKAENIMAIISNKENTVQNSGAEQVQI
ncbi:unnamed protein product, partial [Coregonus sp. 'balchen']